MTNSKSKTIRVSEELYQELEKILQPRESFGQCIERILRVYRTVTDVAQGKKD